MPQRTHRYLTSPTLTQRPRVEPLRGPVIDWRAVRQYAMPLTLLGTAVVLYLMQSSFATTSELEIASLARQREVILHHNAQLSAEIAELEKPARVRERAYALGMVEMVSSVKLAVPAAAPEPYDAPAAAANGEEETYWQHLAGDVAAWLAASIH